MPARPDGHEVAPARDRVSGWFTDRDQRDISIAAAAFFALAVVHVTGVSPITYLAIIVAGITVGAIGLRRHRPELSWPWKAFVATGVVWVIAGVVEDMAGSAFDLTDDRSLLSDLFAVPGYLLYIGALYGLLHRRHAGHTTNVVLDAALFTVGAAIVSYHVVLAPAFELDDAWIGARMVLVTYPTLALVVLWLAAQLTFAASRQNTSLVLLLIGTAGLCLGDVLWSLSVSGRVPISEAWAEVPYLMTPICISLAMLHPDIGDITMLERAQRTRATRYLAIAAALIAPAVLLLAPTRTVWSAPLTVGLLTLAAARIVIALRREDVSNERMLHAATHDELTGLPTRTPILSELGRVRPGPSALLVIDIDNFKFVNDHYGHDVGDELLRATATRLRATVRDGDIVGRLAGDEFAIVAHGLGLDDVLGLADRIRHTMRRRFDLGTDIVVRTSVSIGVGTSELARPDAALMMRHADTAVYQSKARGRDITTVFDASMSEAVSRRLELERMLRDNVNSPLVSAVFQPIISFPAGKVLGLEALMRCSADGEPVSPAEFIPVAEETGLIVEFGEFVLRTACEQLAFWHATVPGVEDLYVSVNISPRQLVASDIVDTVARALDDFALPPDALWLELTESIMGEDPKAVAAAMAGLRELGVRFAIDDFGTGYSSLSRLNQYPVSRIKIDKAFIDGICSSASSEALVRAILAVASALDLDVTAEGIEQVEQAERLYVLGCTEHQGFLYSRPLAAGDVPDALISAAPPPRAVAAG